MSQFPIPLVGIYYNIVVRVMLQKILFFCVSKVLIFLYKVCFIQELKCFFSTKPNAICADNEKMSVNGDIFSITDIVDVSYKRAKSRYCRYNYGEVIIYTRFNTYHVKNIAVREPSAPEENAYHHHRYQRQAAQ